MNLKTTTCLIQTTATTTSTMFFSTATFLFLSSFRTFQIYGISHFAKLFLPEWSSDDGREGVDLPALVLGLRKVFSDLSF